MNNLKTLPYFEDENMKIFKINYQNRIYKVLKRLNEISINYFKIFNFQKLPFFSFFLKVLKI